MCIADHSSNSIELYKKDSSQQFTGSNREYPTEAGEHLQSVRFMNGICTTTDMACIEPY